MKSQPRLYWGETDNPGSINRLGEVESFCRFLHPRPAAEQTQLSIGRRQCKWSPILRPPSPRLQTLATNPSSGQPSPRPSSGRSAASTRSRKGSATLAPPPRPVAISPSGVPPEDKPWPCNPPPPPPSAAWGWGSPSDPSADPSWGLPAEPPPPVAATCPQAAAVRASRAFFGEHVDNDDDDDEDGLEEERNAVTRFFDDLLEKDSGLRGLYEAEREAGRFLCLVCEGIGVRAGKRFPGCAALVQHAGTVARTKGRLAHRAFADAVGRLFGWGAGRTMPFPADSGNGDASDQAGDLDASESTEMEVA